MEGLEAQSVVPEHPSAMLASVSSHVSRSVGGRMIFLRIETHEFSRHDHSMGTIFHENSMKNAC